MYKYHFPLYIVIYVMYIVVPSWNFMMLLTISVVGILIVYGCIIGNKGYHEIRLCERERGV